MRACRNVSPSVYVRGGCCCCDYCSFLGAGQQQQLSKRVLYQVYNESERAPKLVLQLLRVYFSDLLRVYVRTCAATILPPPRERSLESRLTARAERNPIERARLWPGMRAKTLLLFTYIYTYLLFCSFAHYYRFPASWKGGSTQIYFPVRSARSSLIRALLYSTRLTLFSLACATVFGRERGDG